MTKNIGCFLALLILNFSVHGFTCTDGTGFLPPNNLSIPSSVKNSGLSHSEYNAVIDKVLRVYRPIAWSYGGNLKVNRKWESDVVNAGTYREDNTNNWILNLYGGMARHPLITPDGYASVVCHEIGHHIGGAPKKIIHDKKIWASTEGQSDYFATLKCLRKVFRKDDNKKIIEAMHVPSKVRSSCEEAFPTKWEHALCIRISMAGLSISNVMAQSRELPLTDFETPDQTMVDTTTNYHPVPQCRLDTYFQGAICEVSSRKDVSQKNEVTGTCHKKLKHENGLRPACWYGVRN